MLRSGRYSGTGPSPRAALVTLAAGAMLLGTATWFGPTARAEIPGPKHRIDTIRFENDGQWFVLAVPTDATWAHWTLGNPPRIILDLGDAISEIQDAPGLYEVELDRGPIKRLRTSQFANTVLDRRVRITLELSTITPYEARRVGDEVRILVEAPGVEGDQAWIDARGLHTGEPGPATKAPAATSPRPSPPNRSAERLNEALAEAFGGSREPKESAKPVQSAPHGDTPSHAPQTDPIVSDPMPLPAPEEHDQTEDPAGDPAPDPPAADPAAEDLAGGPAVLEDEASRMRSTLEELLGKGNVDPVHETAGGDILSAEEMAERLREQEFPEEDWEEWQDFDEAAGIESPDSLRTNRAAHLLRGAIEDWMNGDWEGAERRADRCRRYYGEYPPGAQAGLLLREMYLGAGRTALAASIRAVPALPDTAFFDNAFFRRVLATYFQAEEHGLLLERMESWGHLYPEGDWYARYHFALGRTAYLARDVARAEGHLSRVRLDDEGGEEALIMRARLFDEAGRELDALSVYRQLAKGGSGVYALRGLARTADLEFQRGRSREAGAAYGELLASDPPAGERAWAQYQLGNLHLLAGESERAERFYQALVDEQPGSYWARFAQERLDAIGWEGGLARRIDEMRTP